MVNCSIQGESEKSSPLRCSGILPKRLGFFRPNFTCLLHVPIYDRIRIFIQLTPTLMKLCHIKCDHPVNIECAKCPPSVKRTQEFSEVFPKQLGIFSPNFTGLLYILIYARMQSVIQLPTTVTKLCHIKCDHPACVSADGGHFEHYDGGRA